MRTATVLVVEDESLIRLNAVQIVEDAGYVALDASNADSALKLLEQHPYVDVVFTDVNMPGSMDGLELAHAIHCRWPHIRLIVTSGKVSLSREEMKDDSFLPKPYGEQQLAKVLKHATTVH